jgi:hypothetical protein
MSVRISQDDLVGSWRLLAATQHFDDGSVEPEFGPNAHGYLSYSAAGTVTAVLGDADRPRVAAADPQDGTPEEYKNSAQKFVAYAGSYTLDANSGEVHHSIEVALYPNWQGQSQLRILHLYSDILTITASPRTTADGRTFRAELRWQRVLCSQAR